MAAAQVDSKPGITAEISQELTPEQEEERAVLVSSDLNEGWGIQVFGKGVAWGWRKTRPVVIDGKPVRPYKYGGMFKTLLERYPERAREYAKNKERRAGASGNSTAGEGQAWAQATGITA